MFKNKAQEPLKVRNWNNPEENETRIQKILSFTENNEWWELELEISQGGNVTFEEKFVTNMP